MKSFSVENTRVTATKVEKVFCPPLNNIFMVSGGGRGKIR